MGHINGIIVETTGRDNGRTGGTAEDSMDLETFSHRLGELFEVEKYQESGGWDFAFTHAETETLLRFASAQFRNMFNGLLCSADPAGQELQRVYMLVFPEYSLVEQVIQREQDHGSHGAVIVTHHPCDMETGGRGFVSIPAQQLAALQERKIAIYVLHAPLDCHPRISTSGAVADGLNLKREGTFAPYFAGDAGVVTCQDPESFGSFAERVRVLCEIPAFDPEQVRFTGRPVSKVAILAGGGDDLEAIAEAEKRGADTYLAGHWWTPHPGVWSDQNREALRQIVSRSEMNFLGASHDGTELVVFRDRLTDLFTSWGLETELTRQADHWR